MPAITDSKSRQIALRELLQEGTLSTQDELREELERKGFEVTQSTISRDLKKVGAVKAVDLQGSTIYRLPEETMAPMQTPSTMRDLVNAIRSNGMIIVIHTTPGSASLVARKLDSERPADILGTIAGDDTIFVAPGSAQGIPATIAAIEQSLSV